STKFTGTTSGPFSRVATASLPTGTVPRYRKHSSRVSTSRVEDMATSSAQPVLGRFAVAVALAQVGRIGGRENAGRLHPVLPVALHPLGNLAEEGLEGEAGEAAAEQTVGEPADGTQRRPVGADHPQGGAFGPVVGLERAREAGQKVVVADRLQVDRPRRLVVGTGQGGEPDPHLLVDRGALTSVDMEVDAVPVGDGATLAGDHRRRVLVQGLAYLGERRLQLAAGRHVAF